MGLRRIWHCCGRFSVNSCFLLARAAHLAKNELHRVPILTRGSAFEWPGPIIGPAIQVSDQTGDNPHRLSRPVWEWGRSDPITWLNGKKIRKMCLLRVSQ